MTLKGHKLMPMVVKGGQLAARCECGRWAGVHEVTPTAARTLTEDHLEHVADERKAAE